MTFFPARLSNEIAPTRPERVAVSVRSARRVAIALIVGALGLVGISGCGADDPAGPGGPSGSGGTGGDAGSGSDAGGQAGASGRGGTGGNAGSGGGSGSGGSAGSSGKGGNAGVGGSSGNAGTGGSGGRAGAGASGGTAGGGPDAGRGGTDAGGGAAGRDAGGNSDDAVTADGSADSGDGGTADTGACMVPSPNDTTITAYQSDIVAKLAGQTEIASGVKITNRATTANRQTVRTYLKTLFQDLALTPVEHAYGSGTNVYATLPSTTGGTQSVVFGAHYDTVMVAPGANDNATGVAAVFAVARYATKLSCRSKSLIFVLFDEEEVGLVGSKQFATKLKTDGTPIHSVHTIDQMGWDQNANRAIELELPDTGLRELYEAAVSELGVSIAMKSTTTSSTDHSSFRPTFLAIGLTEEYTSGDTTPYYHKAGDTFDTVNFPYLLSTTVLVNQVVADLMR